jgi:hypothetical protein
MPQIDLPFAVQEGNSSSPQNSQETLVNMWAEVETSGRKKLIRRQRPGLTNVDLGLTSVSHFSGMGAIERNGDFYYVLAGGLFYFFSSVTGESGVGGVSSVGAFRFSQGVSARCGIVFNDNGDLLLSIGGVGAILLYEDIRNNPSSVPGKWISADFTVLATPDSVSVGTLAFLAGRGIFNVPDTGQFYWTEINDFVTVDALSFATAESFQDPILRVLTLNYQLLVWGSYSTEFWSPTGNADAPFQPIPNATMNRGIAGPYALAVDDNTVHWVGDDGVVYRLDGYRPSRISTDPIERLIAGVALGDRQGCDGLVYTLEGQKFVTFRFGEALTIQYNIATGLWNRAESHGSQAWQILGSATRASEYFLTPQPPQTDGPSLVQLDPTANKDQGQLFTRKMVSAPADANGKRVTISELLLDVEVGRMAEGTEPQIMLRVARDGETFGNTRTRSLGTRGDYKRRMMFRNLGQGRRPALEVSISDDVNLKVISAVATVKVDNS